MYEFRTKAGVMVIAPEGAGWVLTFNGVWLGAYASAHDAARAVAVPTSFEPAVQALLSDLLVPADLSTWRRRPLRAGSSGSSKR